MTLRPHAGVVADAVHRAEDRVALVEDAVETGVPLFHATVVVQEHTTKALYNRTQVGNGAATSADVDDALPREIDRDIVFVIVGHLIR